MGSINFIYSIYFLNVISFVKLARMYEQKFVLGRIKLTLMYPSFLTPSVFKGLKRIEKKILQDEILKELFIFVNKFVYAVV